MSDQEEKIVARNRRAFHDYHIDETIETGIALTGTEVKSVRQGRVSVAEAYAQIDRDEAWIHGMHIAPYEQGNRYNVEPLRSRKLLLHRREIIYLKAQTQQKGMTLVPVSVYFKRGKVKIELGLARGKKLYDKRQDMAARDAQRELERHLRGRHAGEA